MTISCAKGHNPIFLFTQLGSISLEKKLAYFYMKNKLQLLKLHVKI
ncbi:MAG: hypothetical protein Kow0042_00940 [Calditrichia bacterium]